MQLRKFIRHLMIIALVLILIGPILFLTEKWLLGEGTIRNAINIASIAIFFFTYTISSLVVHCILLRRRNHLLTSYYLFDKMLRLGLGVILLLLYRKFINEHILIFSFNVFFYFLVTALLTTIYSIKAEKSEYKR